MFWDQVRYHIYFENCKTFMNILGTDVAVCIYIYI